MAEERIEVGALARDVSVQVATQVANTVAAAKTNELLAASASAEASRVSAEQGRVTAEQGRVTAEQGRVAAEAARATEFAGFEDDIAAKLSKGDYDATTGVGYADNADQLNSPDFTTDQVPYLYRTSGGDADIGNREKDTIVGGSLGWNQSVLNGNVADSSHIAPTRTAWELTSTLNNIAKFTRTSETWSDSYLANFDMGYRLTQGHKYLAQAKAKITTSTTDSLNVVVFPSYQNIAVANNVLKNTWVDVAGVAEGGSGSGDSSMCYIRVGGNSNSLSQGDTVEITNVMVIDLTACFGPTIADYIYSLEQANAGAGVAWFRKYFPKSYYPYKAIGGFLHVKLISHDMVHFNQYDGSRRVGKCSVETGIYDSFATSEHCSNPLKVIPNAAYFIDNGAWNNMCCYDADMNFLGVNSYTQSGTGYILTLQPNTHYLVINFGTRAESPCNLNLSWSGWRNGQYEAYKKNSYPLDTSVILRGIPKLDADNNLYYDGDRYESSGKVTRRLGIVDLGTFNWAKQGDYLFYRNGLTPAIKPASSPTTAMRNVRVSDGRYVNTFIYNLPKSDGYYVAVTETGGIYFNRPDGSDMTVEQFKAAMSGVYLVYELAEPTEETADPFQETQEVDDFGTEEYVVPEQDGVAIPVGHYTEYPENLRDKLRRLPNMPTVSESTTATFVVNYNGQTKKCSFVPINDWLVANGYPTGDALKEVLASKEALGGTLRQTLCVKESLDFDDTKVIDLSELSYTYNSEYQMFTGAIADIKKATDYAVAGKIMSTSYKTVSVALLEQNTSINMVVAVANSQSVVRIRNTTYTDPTAFKDAMKGVLLAYEKASE